MNTATDTLPALPVGSNLRSAAHTGLFDGFRQVLLRDLRVARRRRADVAAGLAFFVIVASLFPLAIGPEPQLLRALGPGVVWVAALLAALLAMPRLFADDHQDGSLEQLLLAAHPLPLLVLGKVAAHWIGSGLLLALVSPLLALQYGLSAAAAAVLLLTLLLGTPVLSLAGAIGAALTVGLRGAAVLLSLLALPLVVPVLVFGAGAVQAVQSGVGIGGHLSLLGALLLFTLCLAPPAAAAALRIAID